MVPSVWMTGYQEFFLITKIPVGRQLPEISAISVSFALAHIRYNNNYVKSQTEPVGKKAGSRWFSNSSLYD